MASAPTGEGYRFHHLCGRRAKISNRSRTAERTQSRGEFNNAVVITSQPLRDHEALQVKIDSKVPTWTGSVLIGATSTPPGNFTFPPSISGLASAWVCNGECVWRNGEKILNSYGHQRLAFLSEGDTVGIVRRGSCLHFLVNGKDLGVAEMHLPFGRVYGIIDIYGQCTKVTIVEPPAGPSDAQVAGLASASVSAVGDMPRFHRRCGNLVEVGEDGRTALRKNCLGEFNHGVVLTDRVLRPSELFEVEIVKMVDKWAGSIEIGVTTHSPEDLDFPSTMTNLHTGTWIMSGTGVMHNGDTIKENYGRSLDTLKKGERVGVMRKDNGNLLFFINGRELGVAAMDLPREVYAVVDLYGQCAEVRIMQAETSGGNAGSYRQENVVAGHQVSGVDSPLRFHEVSGENAEISTDGLSASRMQPYDEFTRATVFTHRPLRANEWFQVRVGVFIDCWSGSVQLGVCKVSPSELSFDDFEEISDVESTWVLSGTELFHGGSQIESDYPLDLDEIPMESKIAVMVTSSGDLHFALDGVDMGSAAKDIPSGVYGVVDVYGQCAQVALVPFDDNTEAGHVTMTPPTRPVASRAAVTPDIIPTSEGVAPPPVVEASTASPSEHGFHPRCGRNIQLTESSCVATRLNSYKDGVVFSARPLRDGKVFKVELSKLNVTWKGVLRIGLTTCDPASFSVVPSLCTGLPPHTWIVSGSSVLADGRVVAENYGMSLSRLQAGDTVGVLRSHSGAMQVCVNDQDLGPAVYGVPENVHAVLDLYGTAHCVKVVSDSRTPTEQSSDKPETMDVSSSERGAVTFALSCGQNIKLSEDRKSAERVKSYSKGIVVSDVPLPNDRLFQVEIKRIEPKWSGSVMLGVTSLPPSQACLPDKASALAGESIVLCAHNDTTSVFIAGQEKLQSPGSISLLSLKAGHTIGILCRLESLHFFVNGSHVVRLTQRIPERRYAVVDLYGQCCKVELKPLVPLNDKLSQLLTSEVVQLREVDAPRNLEPTQPKQHTVREKANSSVPPKGIPYQLTSRAVANGPVTSLAGVSKSSKDLTPQQAKQLWAASKHTKPLQKNGQLLGCPYQQLCQNFIKSLLLPEPYFVPEYHKCYCERCAANRNAPAVNYAGEPPRKYALPLGWAKFAVHVGPQAGILEVFRKWHVAYHGTAVARVRKILDCGELMFPGDMTLHSSEVSQPEGHYTEKCKPRDFDVHQVFVSPSIKYCTGGEVYAKSYGYTDPVTNEMYRAKVAFKLRIQPDSYTVSPQTVLTADGTQVDENFSNSELEWSTKRRKVIILYGLLVKLEPIAIAEHR